MLLIISNSLDATADYLGNRLRDASVPFVRFDTDLALTELKFSYHSQQPRILLFNRWYEPDSFSHVWYRRPESLGGNRNDLETPEAKCILDEWSEVLEGFFGHIPRSRWMNFPASNVLASRKLEQLSIATKFGLLIPETLVTQDELELREFFRQHDGMIVVKALGRASVERHDGNNDSIIYTNTVDESQLIDLSDLSVCPAFFQEAIQKRSDVRITYVDGKFHAVELIARDSAGKQRCDVRRNNMCDVIYRSIDIPSSIQTKLQGLIDFYGLRFAAVDMAISEDDQWCFFEVNPNGQWAWLDLAGATNIYLSFIEAFR